MGNSSGATVNASGSKKVIVVGAGFSGLSAANTILRSTNGEVDVIVVEALDRVGGRALTKEVEFGRIEMGATWFHGVQGHPLVDVALKAGLVTQEEISKGVLPSSEPADDTSKEEEDDDDDDPAFWFSNFDTPGAAEPLSGHDEEVVKAGFTLYTKAFKDVKTLDLDPTMAVGDYLRTKFQEAVSSQGLTGKDLDLFSAAWNNRELLQRAIDGYFSTDDVSVAHVKAYSDLPGALLPVPCGCQAIAKALAQSLDIRFGWQVANIDWSGREGAAVRVQSTDGRELLADAVIVTVSIGVLQAHHAQLFTPTLPPAKLTALASVRLGVADKLFLQFIPPTSSTPPAVSAESTSQPPSSQPTPSEVSNSMEDKLNGDAKIRGVDEDEMPDEGNELNMQAAALLWPANAEDLGPKLVHPFVCGGHEGQGRESIQTPPYTGCSADPSDPSAYLGNVSEMLWGNTFKYIYPNSINVLNPDGTSRGDVLANAWVVGEGALKMESLSEEQLQASMWKLLETFPALSELPRNAQLKVFRTDWGRNPRFYGSYSYIAAGADSSAVEQLGESLEVEGKPVVLFAGEATHPKYMGTTHGAYLSGEREAGKLLQAWGYDLVPSS